jgi:hypothetical protein
VLAGNCDVTARNAACRGSHFILYSLLKPVKMRHGRVAVRSLPMCFVGGETPSNDCCYCDQTGSGILRE